MRIQALSDALPSPSASQAAGRGTRTADDRPVAAVTPTGTATGAPDESSVLAAVNAANQSMAQARAQVQFSIDEDSGRTLIKVVDTESHQVIRQIPTAEMLVIARNIDKLQGLIVRGVA